MEALDVLVVEDDTSIRELYVAALRAADLTVEEAPGAAVGVKAALARHPKVILMDILMPDMNGHEAVAEIRKDDWGADACVIYLTNLSDPADVVKAVGQGSDDYIVKANTDVKDVVNKVRTAMHNPR